MSTHAKVSILSFEITSQLEGRSLMLTTGHANKTLHRLGLSLALRATGGKTDHYTTADLKQQGFVRIPPQESEELLADPLAQKIIYADAAFVVFTAPCFTETVVCHDGERSVEPLLDKRGPHRLVVRTSRCGRDNTLSGSSRINGKQPLRVATLRWLH
jgi:hypothetical protein